MTAPKVDMRQIEQTLIDEFFDGLRQQSEASQPSQIQPSNQIGPRHVTPQHLLERQQIEAQLHALIDASVAHLYELLQQKFAEVRAAQDELIETERARLAEQREWQARQARKTVGVCAPSRQDFYS